MEIKTITERNTFEKYFEIFFQKNNTYIKSKSGNLEVHYLGYFKGLAALHFPVSISDPEYCLLFSRVKDNIAVASLNFFSQKTEDIYFFTPQKFQIITKPRIEERQNIKVSDQKIVLMSSILTENMIISNMKRKRDSIDKIKEVIDFQERKNFDYIKSFFDIKENRDARMKYFRKGHSLIYIPDFNKPDMGGNMKLFNFYQENIYPSDSDIREKNKISGEISVPVLYNGLFPIGYIQVNSYSPMRKTQINLVERMALLAESMTHELKFFTENESRFIVSDISRGGFSIAFKNPEAVKMYTEGALVSLELQLPMRRKARMLALVRHTDILSNGLFRVGFKIHSIDEEGRGHFTEYIDSL